MPMPSTVAGRMGASGPRAARLAARSLRRHWLLAVLLAAGLVLRILVQIAYRPALFYIDSIKYLFGAYPGDDPPGYQLVLRPFLAVANPGTVAAVQHLLGLGMAVALYALLLRKGSPRWLAALATAPVLLDGYQLQMEQTVMPDVLFEALMVAGLVVLLWRPRPQLWMVAGGRGAARQHGDDVGARRDPHRARGGLRGHRGARVAAHAARRRLGLRCVRPAHTAGVPARRRADRAVLAGP